MLGLHTEIVQLTAPEIRTAAPPVIAATKANAYDTLACAIAGSGKREAAEPPTWQSASRPRALSPF